MRLRLRELLGRRLSSERVVWKSPLIHSGAGMPPPLRRIQVEELPAPVEVSLGVADSLALAPLLASPASISTLVDLTAHSAATGGLGAFCTPTKATGSPAVVEPVFVAVASPPPVALAAAAVAAPRKRRLLSLGDGEFFTFENPTIFI